MKLYTVPNGFVISFCLIGMFNPVPIQGFLVSKPDPPAINPILAEFARDHAEEGIKLNIRLDIMEDVYDVKSSHLFIKDLMIELKNKEPNQENPIRLPPFVSQSSSPVPMVRTGPLALETHTNGSFISSTGCQTLILNHGCWELLWLEAQPTGSIICAFDMSEDVSRNDAVLKAGGVYISFPAFTKKGLMAMRAEQNRYQCRLQLQVKTEREELDKVNATNNLFKKFVHFRNAVLANEQLTRLRSLGNTEVPTEDKQFMQIGDDLMVYSKGSVWSKEENSETIFVGQASLKM